MLLKFFVKMLATDFGKKILKNLSEPNTVHSTVLVFILDGKYRAKRNFSLLRLLQSKDKKRISNRPIQLNSLLKKLVSLPQIIGRIL